jgi:hypothetical protein
MSLKDRALQLNSNGGVPFMEGRTKGDNLPLNSPVTIDDYGFIDGEDGEYVVISLKEFPKNFYFGGSVVTEKMQDIEKDITPDEKKEIHSSGLPVLFSKRKNKAGKKEYTTCVFYPDEMA